MNTIDMIWIPLANELEKDFPENKAENLDPGQELDWYSITVGWAIAKGLNYEEALDFATRIRYRTNLM